MSTMLLDATALLALLFDEKGADVVAAALDEGAALSAATVAEVAARLQLDGWSDRDVSVVLGDLNFEVIPVDAEIALLSGVVRQKTQKLGLCLGDRLCLATAAAHERPVLTADKTLKKIRLPNVKIKCVR